MTRSVITFCKDPLWQSSGGWLNSPERMNRSKGAYISKAPDKHCGVLRGHLGSCLHSPMGFRTASFFFSSTNGRPYLGRGVLAAS